MMKENLLMETAMCIMETFCVMYYEYRISEDRVHSMGSLERLQLFCSWAREFEDKYAGTEEYENDFLGLIDKFATEKINEEFTED